MQCSKGGLKIEGASCSLNNKCIFPYCIKAECKHCGWSGIVGELIPTEDKFIDVCPKCRTHKHLKEVK